MIILGSVDQVFAYLVNAIDTFEERGSGWELVECGQFCDVYLATYKPIRGSSYIPLPKWLRTRKSILNIRNVQSEDCFTLSILADLYPIRVNVSRPSKYEQHSHMLDCSMLTYPVSFDQIRVFEAVSTAFCLKLPEIIITNFTDKPACH